MDAVSREVFRVVCSFTSDNTQLYRVVNTIIISNIYVLSCFVPMKAAQASLDQKFVERDHLDLSRNASDWREN